MGYNPPYVDIGQQWYGNVATFLNTAGLLYPTPTGSIDYHEKLPVIYNWSLGIQRALPGKLALDVSYVGNTERHLQSSMDLNALPPGCQFLPQNTDPTTGAPLNNNLLTTYREYTTLTQLNTANTANYNSMQVNLTRRFASGLQFGIAYTFSKALGTEPGTCNNVTCIINQYVPSSQWIRGMESFNAKSVFVANYQYELPKLSSLLPNPAVKAVFDNWELSGIYTYSTGNPFTLNFTSSAYSNPDGSSADLIVRPNVVAGCNPNNAPHTFAEEFNTACFTMSALGTFGDSGPNDYIGPPINQLDLSLMKNIPLGKSEARRFRFKAEAFNVLNHTQFTTLNYTARFNAAGQQINSLLSQQTADRQARVLQLAGTLYF